MNMRRATGTLVAALSATTPVVAQQVQLSPVLTLDQDRMYATSAFGQRVQAELQAQSVALSQENRKIEAALEAEERRLTEERASMDPAAFRVLAEDFDERVTGIRRAQAAKADSVRKNADEERARFFEAAFPILLELVEETGAVAILNNSAVIFSVRNIDITDAVIERIDATVGESPPPVDTGPLPVQRPASDDISTEDSVQTDGSTTDSE